MAEHCTPGIAPLPADIAADIQPGIPLILALKCERVVGKAGQESNRRGGFITNYSEFSLLELETKRIHTSIQDTNVLLYTACIADRRRLGSIKFRLQV